MRRGRNSGCTRTCVRLCQPALPAVPVHRICITIQITSASAITTTIPIVMALFLEELTLTVSRTTWRSTLSSLLSGSGMRSVLSNSRASGQTAGGHRENRDREAGEEAGDRERRCEARPGGDRADGDRADADARVEGEDHAAERAR